ncbi:SRPBCC family protein [Sorangium sp. So ce1182]|uniref:SRPBCC family protein n=1 Tax=Sorangium sp. So ce1182 TaxID=3133334 RepID=UPI003F62BA35
MNVFDRVLRTVLPRRRYGLGDAAAAAAGLGVGAGLMYTLDPDRGARRRASARDMAVSLARRAGALLDESTRDLGSRGGIPSSQGPSARTDDRVELAMASGSPAARLLIGALGAGLVGYAIKRRGPLGGLLGVAGATVLLQAATSRPARPVLDIVERRQGVDFQQTITVRAPLREVFLAFIQFESFPLFMSHLREVETLGDGRMRWIAVGPAGIPVSWDAELTQLVPNEVIAWRSLPGQAVENEGAVQLEACPEGTRLHVTMSYNPPAGALGHGVATLLGADPERAMNDDLARFKALIEQGRTTAQGDEVVLGDLQVVRST